MDSEQTKKEKILSVSPKSLKGSEQNRSTEQVLSDMHIERLELPINTARKVSYILGILFIIILIWAAIAPVNVIAKGKGQLRPFGKPKLVQSQINGQIDAILVQEGSHVLKDAILVELGATVFKSKLDKAMLELKKGKLKTEQFQEGLKALRAVIENPAKLPLTTIDIGGTADVVNKVYTTYKSLQESKYDATVGAASGSLLSSEMTDLKEMKSQYGLERGQKERELSLLRKQLQSGVAQKKTSISGITSKIASHKEMLKEVEKVYALSKEQEKDYADVVDLGVSRVQYLKVKEQVAENSRKVQNAKTTIRELENKLALARLELPRFEAETKSRIVDLQASIKAINANIENVNIKMRKAQREYRGEDAAYNAALERAKASEDKLRLDLDSQEKQIKELEDSIKIAQSQLSKAVVRAPMSGIVTGLKIRGTGEVLRQGQELMEILPDKSNLVIEAQIANKDIGFVKPDQIARVKLDAFPFQDFGVIEGKVEEIEKYPEQHEKMGYTYKVWVKPKQDYILARGQKVKFRSGLTAQVEIVVRRVTILQALLSPVAKLTEIRVKE